MTWNRIFEQLMTWAGDVASLDLPRSMRRLRSPASFAQRCAQFDDEASDVLMMALRFLISHGKWPKQVIEGPEEVRWLLYLRLDFVICRISAFKSSGFQPPQDAARWLSQIALLGWPEWRRDAFRIAAIEHLCPHIGVGGPPSLPWLQG